ncbi:MAG TPA: MlaD family protein [Solirubrobacterales bacterium]|nr:MlaD family protein [Solirubrobacterales bacterium]
MWRSPREKSRLRPEIVGILVILGLVFAFYVAASKHLPFISTGHKMHFEFASANQIAPNAPVRIAGVNVGKVESIDAGPGHTADVTVSLDDEALPLHSDATARIRPRTFLEGAFFMDVTPGSPSAPELSDGATIPVGQTADPVQFDQILTTLQPPVRESLRSALHGLSTALSGGGPRGINRTIPVLNPLFRDSAIVNQAFTGTEPNDLGGAIRSSARVATALAQNRTELGSVVSSFSTVAAALSSRQRQLGQTIGGLDNVLRESPPTLDAINAATPDADSLISAARPLLRRAPSVVNPSVPLSGQVRKLIQPSQLPALVSLAAPTVRSLAGAAPDTTVAFAGLRGPTSCLLHNALPTLKTPVDDGALSTGQPVYRELLYDLTGLASASRNFDGNGFATRYYAGFGDETIATPLGSPSAQLFGLSNNPIAGARPVKPPEAPPLRPDVPCTQDAPANLAAASGPGGFSSAGQADFAAPPGTPSAPDVINKLTGGGK